MADEDAKLREIIRKRQKIQDEQLRRQALEGLMDISGVTGEKLPDLPPAQELYTDPYRTPDSESSDIEIRRLRASPWKFVQKRLVESDEERIKRLVKLRALLRKAREE